MPMWTWRLLLIGAAAILLLLLLPAIADRVADRSFGNVTPARDAEPAATAWSPRWSEAEIGALIGRGEGLDCSISPGALSAFHRSGESSAPVALRFRQACMAHDYCYRHGRATYGYTQQQCDAALADAAFRICRKSSAAGVAACVTEARKVLGGVTLGGTDSYRPAADDPNARGMGDEGVQRDSTVAEYDPYPQPAADFTLPRVTMGDCGCEWTRHSGLTEMRDMAGFTEISGAGKPWKTWVFIVGRGAFGGWRCFWPKWANEVCFAPIEG